MCSVTPNKIALPLIAVVYNEKLIHTLTQLNKNHENSSVLWHLPHEFQLLILDDQPKTDEN